MEKFVYDVVIGVFVAVLGIAAKWQWPLIRSLFDAESRRQARQIVGTWNARELFADGTQDEFLIDMYCSGGKVSGSHRCLAGFDKDRTFHIDGTYKDQVLAVRWMPSDNSLLESGTVTAKLMQDGRLQGHGLYVEPTDGRVYTSEFIAQKNRN